IFRGIVPGAVFLAAMPQDTADSLRRRGLAVVPELCPCLLPDSNRQANLPVSGDHGIPFCDGERLVSSLQNERDGLPDDLFPKFEGLAELTALLGAIPRKIVEALELEASAYTRVIIRIRKQSDHFGLPACLRCPFTGKPIKECRARDPTGVFLH